MSHIPTMKDLERWDEIISNKYSLNIENRKWLLQFHLKMTNRSLFNKQCSNKFQDAIAEIEIEIRKLKKTNPIFKQLLLNHAPRRKLRRGMVIHFEGLVFTRSTMTEEIIEKFLLQYPNRQNDFELINSNYNNTDKLTI